MVGYCLVRSAPRRPARDSRRAPKKLSCSVEVSALNRLIALCAAAAAFSVALPAADPETETARQILALERQGMDGWTKGDPGPQLATFAPEITYFHIMTDKRLDGLPAVKELYERFRGTPLFDSYEIVDPSVQVAGDVAVLTYIFVRHNGDATSRWNATEVYQRKKDGWRIIHTHFSATRTQ
jgi:ketosteroid isomerase-like protein